MIVSSGLRNFAWGLLLLACSGSQRPDALQRSPTLDYQDSPRMAGHGREEVLGADGMDPSDRLKAGARADSLAPGWEWHDGRLRFDEEAARRGRHHQHCQKRVPEGPDAGPESSHSDEDCVLHH